MSNRNRPEWTIDERMRTDQNGPTMQPELPPAAGETIGKRLKRLRLDRGFSQRELAAPGVSYAYISRIEAGTRQPSVKALRRLAAKLDVSAGYLETGSHLDAAETRELRLADFELAIRLGEEAGAETPLRELVDEAIASGDRASALRGRVALAQLAQQRGRHREASELIEAALEGEPFSPVDKVDIYSQLGRAYTEGGDPQRAVDLFERSMTEIAGTEPTLEARYATLLSYALSDMGDLARAENIVHEALERVDDIQDPYTRVRLYWSIARLALTEGRAAVALTNIRKAIALLQATDDTFHLGRAHILAAYIMLSHEDAGAAERHLDRAESLLGVALEIRDQLDLATQRARVAVLQGHADEAVRLARLALELAGSEAPVDRGLALSALGDALVLEGNGQEAGDAYAEAVDLLESQGRWRHATTACRAWGRMLRETGQEEEAMDVLERAAELGMRAAPAEAHAER
jgi:tetratricopeptide (TPR) repeat protein